MKFEPINLGRWMIWSLFALILMVAPLIFTQGASHFPAVRKWAR